MPPTEAKLRAVFKAQQFRLRYPAFVFSTAKKLLDDNILREIHQKMQAKKFSKKIIAATRITNVQISMAEGKITFDVISDYKDPESGFDVSKGREEGTKDHRTPKFKFKRETKKKVQHWTVKGKDFFSFGHWVKGIQELRIIKTAVKQKLPLVQEKLDAATNANFDRHMNPGGKR